MSFSKVIVILGRPESSRAYADGRSCSTWDTSGDALDDVYTVCFVAGLVNSKVRSSV
jgi:hypothetical protein